MFLTTKPRPSPAFPADDTALALLEASLRKLLSPLPPGPLGEAMEAAVFPGGKRLRPRLLLATAHVFSVPAESLTDAAAVLELVHCASLVLDDLPCMDDAVLRRGQPTLHRRFSQATAILAAFALLARAQAHFPRALARAGLAPAFCSQWSEALARLVETLCQGQQLDLLPPTKGINVEHLEAVHAGKTGSFFQFAAELGAFAGGADRQAMSCVSTFARNLGLAYQVVDDVRDLLASSDASGKPQGQDSRLGRATFVTLLGLDGARQLALELLATAEAALSPLAGGAYPLRRLLHDVRSLL